MNRHDFPFRSVCILISFSFSLLGLYSWPCLIMAQQPITPIKNSSVQTNADFIIHPVDMNIPGIHCVKVLDLDFDGDEDIVGGSENTPYSSSVGLVWWRNDGGYPVTWTRFTIDSTFLHVMSVDVGYVDEDTLPDIVASGWSNGKISWWKNSGNPESGWTAYPVVTGWTNPHDAVCSDIDGDGKNDIVGAAAGDNTISVFYNQGGALPAWQEEIVDSNFGGAKSIIVEDLDNDYLPDLIGAGDACDDIAWWKNLGGIPVSWEKQLITTNLDGSINPDAEDMNYDGQPDIIGAGWAGNEVSFWTCEGIATNSWEKTLVTNQLAVAVKGIGRDIDLDNDKDIIAVGKVPGELAIFYNENGVFTKDILFPDFNGGTALAVIDMDHDGDDDIVAGAGVLKQLYLFENQTITTSLPGTDRISSTLLVFPNPSSGEFTVTIPGEPVSEVEVLIIDSNGKTVLFSRMNPDNNRVMIKGHGLAVGSYLIKISAGKKIFTGSLFHSFF